MKQEFDLDNALTHLLKNAINTSKPKAAGAKVTRYAFDDDYKISDIRIISINGSLEYKTWTVDIAVKKDGESANQMKRFKLSIPENKVPMWQDVQLAAMEKASDDFDIYGSAEEEPASEIADAEVVKSDIDIVANEELIIPTGSAYCDHKWDSPFGNEGVCLECGIAKNSY